MKRAPESAGRSFSRGLVRRCATALRCALLALAAWAASRCGTVWAAPAPPSHGLAPALRSDLARLRDAALRSDYAWQQCAWLCDHIGPRLSGSPQAAAAVAHVAARMRDLGLDVRLEPVEVPHWVRGEETGAIVAWPGQPKGVQQRLALTALGGSIATAAEGLRAPVLVVESMTALEALPDDVVRGTIVLFDVAFDKALARIGQGGEAYDLAVQPRVRGASLAARKGAVAALVRSAGGAEFRLPHTGNMRYADGVPKVPAAAVAAEDAMLIARLARQGRVELFLRLTPQTLDPARSFNVVADLRGSQRPEEIVLVSGHLDSWDLGTGALDDAAGVAVAMETMQLLTRLDLHPARTVRMVAWMNEENGLAGARAYAALHRAEISRHVAALESDLGAGHPAGFNLHGSAQLADLLEPVTRILAGAGAPAMQRNPWSGGADISPLDDAGVPTLGLLQDSRTYFDYHHTAADTLDKIDPAELRVNAAVAAVLTYALAGFEGDVPR